MYSDLKYAIRQLIKAPGFTIIAVLTLALGIGACTAMFSIVNAVVLKPLPFREPTRLVWIENIFGGGLSGRTSRSDTFNDWREQSRSFAALGAYFAFSDYGAKVMTGTGDPERLRDVGVSGDFLTVLGVKPLHGRNFSSEECAWEGPGAAILSYKFWQRRFTGDPAIVGQKIILNNKPVTIVGVLPRTFDFAAVFTPGNEVELLTPFPLVLETAGWGNTVFGIGRLRAGVSAQQAQAELDVLNVALQKAHPERYEFGARVTPLDGALRGRFHRAFFILAGAVLCVLAIACVNLSNLLLARFNARRQEFAVRVSLGASRGHLVRQALTESLLLAFAGAVVGLPLAMWAAEGLARWQTFGVPLLQDAAIDPSAFAFTVGLTTVAGIVCGLLPALHLSRSHAGSSLQTATHQRSAGRSTSAVRNTLVVAEIALACILLVGAGLLIRSFNSVLAVNLGFQPQHAMAWRLSSVRNFNTIAEANAYFDGAVARIAAIPGITAVGLSDTLPLGRHRSWGAGAKDVNYPKDTYPIAFPRIVDQHYLQAMAIPLRAGRYFDDRDTGQSQKSIIINENLARHLWPDLKASIDPVQYAIGQVINVNDGSTIVGVVGNVRHSSLEDAGGNEMYLNYRQTGWGVMDMVVRSTRPAESLVPEVRTVLAAYDPNLPNGEFYELEHLIDNSVAPRRLITQLLGFFSTLSLTLAALGLYGVIAYSVAQRTHEIGIRMALGAQRRDVLGLILHGGLRLVLTGIGIGLVGSLALARLMQSQLFGITAYDPLTFIIIAALLLATAILACWIPARRSTRVDPVEALRAE